MGCEWVLGNSPIFYFSQNETQFLTHFCNFWKFLAFSDFLHNFSGFKKIEIKDFIYDSSQISE